MNKKPKSTKRNKWILFLLALIISGLYSNSVSAQWSGKKHRSPRNYGYSTPSLYVGMEGVAGIRSFRLTSNFAQFNNVPVIEQGQSVGFVIGSSAIMFKVRHGSFKSSHTTSKEFGLKETTVSFNVSPLQFGSRGSSNFQPYVLVDIDVNNVSLYGTPLPKEKLTQAPKLPCHDDHGLPGDPDAGSGSSSGPPSNPGQGTTGAISADPDATNEGEVNKTYIGTLKAVRASVGAGLMVNISGKKTFAKLFTEAKYGTSFKTTSTNLDLRSTKVTGQFSLNFGVMMGVNALMFGKR